MNTNWINNFIEKNAWAILSLLVFGGVFVTRVSALEQKMESLEDIQKSIIENQKAVIEMKTRQDNFEKNFLELKEDIKDIKRAVGVL